MNKTILKYLKFTFLIFLISSISFVSFILYNEINSIPAVNDANFHYNNTEPFIHDYYEGLIRKYLIKNKIFDKNTIPLYPLENNLYYHPVYIIQYALGAYYHYQKKGDDKAKAAFLKCANWLEENLKKHGRFHYWEYNFKWTYPGLDKPPWFSAMAQGEGASVLLRAYYETNDKKYLYAAEKAIEPILYDMSVGGISVIEGNSYLFPQEYSSNPPSDTLNGAITAYVGVYEYYQITRNHNIKKMLDIMSKTFSNTIDEFDSGYWSFKSLQPRYLANGHYNRLHVRQLQLLYLMTNDEKFLIYADKFKNYQARLPNKIRFVLARHLRQAKEFTFSDIKKIPVFIVRYL